MIPRTRKVSHMRAVVIWWRTKQGRLEFLVRVGDCVNPLMFDYRSNCLPLAIFFWLLITPEESKK
jgi:hypothetical protein